jgi:hypothetical protein
MAYYDQPLMRSQQRGDGPATIYSPSGTGFVNRDVDENQLVSEQLNDLLRSDSPYVQQARSRAANQAASRGLLNSSMAAGSGEAAAIAAGLPIATADANTYAQTAADNMNAENAFLLSQGGWENAAGMNAMNNATQRAIAMARLGEDARQFNNEFDRAGEWYDTDWDRQIQGAILGSQLGQQAGMNSLLYQTILGNPEYFRDQAGGSGAVNFWSEDFLSHLDQQTQDLLAQYGLVPEDIAP